MLPKSTPGDANANIVIPAGREGNITGTLTRIFEALISGMKSTLRRLAYGDQTSLGSDNLYFFDPVANKWMLRDGSADRNQAGRISPGDPLSPPRMAHKHVDHPYCIAPHVHPLFEPKPFAGVFARPALSTSDSSAQSNQKSAVDMAALSHPVYAPSGSVLTPDDINFPSPGMPGTSVQAPAAIRTSPFNR